MSASSEAYGPGVFDSTPPLRAVHRYGLLTLGLLAGICVGCGAWWFAAAVFALIVVATGFARPEVVIVLFLTAGLYKQDPRINSLVPIDLTVLLGALLALTLLPRLRRVFIPRESILLVPLFTAVGLGLFSPANSYGADKALRFCTLTALVTVASLAIIDSPKRLQRFLVALAILGFVVSVDALRNQDTEWGRLTSSGSNPIPLGRIGAIAFAFAWIRFHFAKNRLERLGMIVVFGFAALCTLASGTRGPVLSTVASLLMLSAVTYSAHRRMPIAIGPLALCAVLGTILFALTAGPTLPLQRFELLVSENKGASILIRGYMFATAWKLTLANPLGIGIGGFDRYAPLELHYPHNLFLEIGCELGWLPLLSLLLFLALGILTTVRILRREYTWHTLFLGLVFLSALMNAMVSGDLNDNRLLYATFLLPFTYSRMQAMGSSGTVEDTGRHAGQLAGGGGRGTSV
jgi:hypothetical protein